MNNCTAKSNQLKILKEGSQTSYGSTSSLLSSSSTLVGCSITLMLRLHEIKYGFANSCPDFNEKGNGKPEFESSECESILAPKINLSGSSGNLDHCHIERDTGIDKKATRKLIIATVLCLFFMIIEIVGGVLANSLSIATDAAHLLTDLVSFMISLFAIWIASRPSTRNMSFGWHRAEVIGATISVLLIWVVTGVLMYAAILRIVNSDFEVDATIMLISSAIGVGVNIVMACSLHQHGHSHGSNCSGIAKDKEANDDEWEHAHDSYGKEKENLNVKAAYIHVIGDFVQSLGVFIAALIICFKPNLNIVDPICTLIFSTLVLATTISILKNTMNILMQGIPNDVDIFKVKDIIMKVPGIVAVHNLRIWGLTADKIALSAHLAIDSSQVAQDILKETSTMIRRKYDIYEMTLQVENYQHDMKECTQCQDSLE